MLLVDDLIEDARPARQKRHTRSQCFDRGHTKGVDPAWVDHELILPDELTKIVDVTQEAEANLGHKSQVQIVFRLCGRVSGEIHLLGKPTPVFRLDAERRNQVGPTL